MEKGKPVTIEAYARATQATNLAMSDYADFRPADWLAAAGAVAVNGNPLASVVARWMAGDKSQVYWATRILKKRLGKTRMLMPADLDEIQDALCWWRDATCKVCSGKGYPVIPDTTALDESKPCQNCVGSGKLAHWHGRDAYAYNGALMLIDEAAVYCAAVIRQKVA